MAQNSIFVLFEVGIAADELRRTRAAPLPERWTVAEPQDWGGSTDEWDGWGSWNESAGRITSPNLARGSETDLRECQSLNTLVSRQPFSD